MFNSLARRTPSEQHADSPQNSQGKQLRLCEDIGSMDTAAAKLSMGEIEGGDQVTPEGSACGGPPVG